MDMADTKINLAGLEILWFVADIEGEHQVTPPQTSVLSI